MLCNEIPHRLKDICSPICCNASMFCFRHCIATISPPDEEYFKDKLPLPHVPGRQGNNLPLGEGCWTCGISQVERAQLYESVANLRAKYRVKRDMRAVLERSDIEKMLSKTIVVNIGQHQTAVREHNHIISLIQTHRHMPEESYKLFGDDIHKFILTHSNKEISLQFNHRVTKTRVHKLVLLISNESKLDDLLLLPVEVRVFT